MAGHQQAEAAEGRGRRGAWRSAAWTRSGPAICYTASGSAPAPAAWPALRADLRARHRRRTARGRGQADRRARRSSSTRTRRSRSSTIPTRASWCCGARARSISRSPSTGCATSTTCAVKSRRPHVPYKETIRKGVAQHARFKRQTGGHGQFGDVHIEIQPLPRGAGFDFVDEVVGGAIPRQFIPSVEEGVREYIVAGAARLPGGRRRGDPDRRPVSLASTARTWRSRPPRAWRCPRACRNATRCCWSRSSTCRSRCRTSTPRASSASSAAGAARSSATTPRPAGRAGTRSAPTCRRPSCTTSSSSCARRRWASAPSPGKFDHLQELTGRLADQVIQARQAAAAE